jgi:hypothetical protein
MFGKSTLPSPRTTIATSSSEGPQQNTEENHQQEQEEWQQHPLHTSSTILRNEWSRDGATITARARQDFVLAVIDSALKTLGTYVEDEEDDKTYQEESNILLPQ